MLVKLTLALCVLGALVAAPAAAGDGPMFVSQGGVGVVHGTTRVIPVADYQGNDTEPLAISTKDGTEQNQLTLLGNRGLPSTPAARPASRSTAVGWCSPARWRASLRRVSSCASTL